MVNREDQLPASPIVWRHRTKDQLDSDGLEEAIFLDFHSTIVLNYCMTTFFRSSIRKASEEDTFNRNLIVCSLYTVVSPF